MRRVPDRARVAEQGASGLRQGETSYPPVLGVRSRHDEAARLYGLEIGGQRRAVHRQQRGDGPERRRLRSIERHQQRKLAAGQPERMERLVEYARHGPRRALRMQAQAGVAHPQRFGKTELVRHGLISIR